MPSASPVPCDFFCEHTPTKSRVFAVLASPGRPNMLKAILACTDPVLAERAASSLGVLASAGGGAAVDAEADEIAAALPTAPAASYKLACLWLQERDWPEADASPVSWDQFRADNEDDDHLTPGTQDVQKRTPSEATLGQLSGKAFRVIQFLEYHVHDPDRLLEAARAHGWPPLSEEDDQASPDDDLLDAIMLLADLSHDVPGADIISQQSTGEALVAGDGDELSQWQRDPVTATFGGGRRLLKPDADATMPARPNFTALFPVQSCSLDHANEDEKDECEVCGHWQLTPRTADILHSTLEVLSDQVYDDVHEIGGEPLTGKSTGLWSFFDRLPRITWAMDAEWRRQVGHACEDLARDLEAGEWPEPRCTAEEMVMHLAIEDAPGDLELRQDAGDEQHEALPEHRDDYDWDACSDLLFQDHDVLMLFDASMDGIEHPDSDVNQFGRIGDLRPAAWFEPFANIEPRDPDRSFRS